MPSNTPQGMLYQMRGQNTAPSDGNGSRNRVAEQQNSAASGNPYNYRGNSNMDWNQFLNGQDQSLGRYIPPTLQGTSPTDQRWNNNQGGYAYNLPTSFGGFGGFSQFSQNPQQGGFNPAGDVNSSAQLGSGGSFGRMGGMRQAAMPYPEQGQREQGAPGMMPPSYMPRKPLEYQPPANDLKPALTPRSYSNSPTDRVRRFLSIAANPNLGLPTQPYTPPEYL